MDRALRLGGMSRNSLYAMLRAGSLPSVVIGCRRFVCAEAIATLISSYTTSVSPSQDAVRPRRLLANAGQADPRVSTRVRKSDAESVLGPAMNSWMHLRCCRLHRGTALSGRYGSQGRIAKCPRSAAT